MSVTATNLKSGEQTANPSFISLLGTSLASLNRSEQVSTLQVYSTDKTVASATYKVDLVVQYLDYPLAQSHCSFFLEIDDFKFLQDQEAAPKFNEEEASGRYKLLDDQ